MKRSKLGYFILLVSLISAIIFIITQLYWCCIISFILLCISIDVIVVKDNYRNGYITKCNKNGKNYVYLDINNNVLLELKGKSKLTKYGKITVFPKMSFRSGSWKMYSSYQRRLMTQSLRADVLHRDKFTCQHCGRKAPDVKLQIDHIYPLAKGGMTEMNNLQVLCEDCNQGKKAKYTD